MPVGSWWGDVLFCGKEDETDALGARAGDCVEIEHAVWGRMITQEYQRVRDGARVLYFVLFISQTHYRTRKGGGGGEGWGEMH